MNKCATCSRRSAAPVSRSVSGRDLYECPIINKTTRIETSGVGTPWIAVRKDFGCVLWKQRKTEAK